MNRNSAQQHLSASNRCLAARFAVSSIIAPLARARVAATRCAAAFMLAMLAGCYESETAVLELGQATVLSGTYDCVSVDGSQPAQTITISERTSDQGGDTAYVYHVTGGGNLQFYELANGRYLAQAARSYKHWGRREKDARYAYFFADIQSKTLFNLYVADYAANPAQLQSLMKTRGLAYKENLASSLQTVTLKGDADALFEFFNGHSGFVLKQTVSCRQSG